MAIRTHTLRTMPIIQAAYNAYIALTSHQYCAVQAQHVAASEKNVTQPSGQGVLCEGILQNAPAINKQADVMHIGWSKAKTAETFNGGVELTPSGTAGTLEAAAAADYVVAIADEPSNCAGAIITVRVIPAYQKNA